MASTRPPRGPRSDLCVVVVTRWACGTGSSSPVKTLPATRPAKCAMSTMKRRADLVGDLAHRGEVDPPRIGGVAGDQDQRLELPRRGAYRVVVEQLGLGVSAVGALMEHLAGDVRPEAVGEVAAGVQRHAERSLVAELVPQRPPTAPRSGR